MAGKRVTAAPKGRKGHEALPPAWEAALRKSDRDDAKIRAWRKARRQWLDGGGAQAAPREPWEDTNLRALSCCPKSREFAIAAAHMAVDDSADLRSLIRAAAEAAGALQRRVAGEGHGPYGDVQDVLFALSNCIERTEANDSSGGTDPRRPPATISRFDMELLRELHQPAAIALRSRGDERMTVDAVETGVHVRTKTGFGKELVTIIRLAVEAGLRGEPFARRIYLSPIWSRGPFPLERVRWANENAGAGSTKNLNGRLVAWALKATHEGLLERKPDFERLAQDALSALGIFTTKEARNIVVAAAENRASRVRGARIG